VSATPAPQPAGADASALPPDAVEVARVLGAWGVKGAIRLKPFAADPQALFSTKRWYLQPPELPTPRPPGAKPQTPWPNLLRVVQAKEHGDGIVATVQDLSDRDAAEALAGARVFVSRSSFPTAGDGEYYWVDLIGLSVVNREGVALGDVTGLIDTGVHSVLRVRRPDATADAAPESGERLIPFVAAYIDSVDLGARRIVVDWGIDY